MAIDLSQFHQIFFEESSELLSGVETALLEFDVSKGDVEKINSIFRAFHSIKGGSATFDFKAISEFSHIVESFLANVREGKDTLTNEDIELLLRTVDQLHTELSQLQAKQESNGDTLRRLTQEFSERLAKEPKKKISEPNNNLVSESLAVKEIVLEQPPKAMEVIEIKSKDEPDLLAPEVKAQSLSIRMSTTKIDNLVNLVGELVITQSMLMEAATVYENTSEQMYVNLQQLERNCHELQESVMRMRMLPVGFVFNRYYRIIHDLSNSLHKKVELKITGEQTELDKNMLEKISDPVTHIIRNAIDHGIETPEERIANGKSAMAQIKLAAYQQGGLVIISICDDGRGIDIAKVLEKAISRGLVTKNDKLTEQQIIDFIFQPGFSTAETVTEISGRGVGMDVAQKSITDLGGRIEVSTEKNKGSCINLELPLSHAIITCQSVLLGGNIYLLPILSVTEILKVDKKFLHQEDNNVTLYHYREHYYPFIDLGRYFNILSDISLQDKFIILVASGSQKFGLLVDKLGQQYQVFVKNLQENYQMIPGLTGATILGDGTLALIIDVHTTIFNTLHPQSKLPSPELTESSLNKSTAEPPILADYLGFVIGEEQFGINVLDVVEVHNQTTIIPLPKTPAFILGLTNIKGNIIVVINLALRLNIPYLADDNSVFIVLKLETGNSRKLFAVAVKKILNTYSIKRTEIQSIKESLNSTVKSHSCGLATVNNKLMTLLDVSKLLPINNVNSA